MQGRLQRTIRQSVETTGIGFLTGRDIHIRFQPAAVNQGIEFRRTDSPSSPPIPARIEFAVHRQRRTAIEYCGIAVEMIEHVMAALAGSRIDNCIVELDGPEPPGLDGSSLHFVELLQAAGIVEQQATRPVLVLPETVFVAEPEDESELTYSASTGPGLSTISVVGPMARHAEDLDLVLRVLAGPDVLQHSAWRVELPAPRHRKLREFRVAVWATSPLCEIDSNAQKPFEAAVAAIAETGAVIDENARPEIGDAQHHRLFMTLLRAATASRLSEAEFAAQKEIAATVAADDMSFRATLARGAALDHRAWGIANETRNKLRYMWRDFFQRFDVLLAPVAATAAFPHDHNPDRDQRLIPVNGRMIPYGDQRFWAGLASLSYLPSTAAPIGLTAAGLPVGLQIIGPEGEDATTIEFARLLANEIGGFGPPTGYD